MYEYSWKSDHNPKIALQPPLFSCRANSVEEARRILKKKFDKIREDIKAGKIGNSVLSLLKSTESYEFGSYVDNLYIFEKTIAVVNQRDPDFIEYLSN